MTVSVGDFVVIDSPQNLEIYRWHRNYTNQIGLVVDDSSSSKGYYVVAVKHYLADSKVPCLISSAVRHADGGTWTRNSAWPKTARLICDGIEITKIPLGHLPRSSQLLDRSKELYELLKSHFNEWRGYGDILPRLAW